jgi:hypothetical protein
MSKKQKGPYQITLLGTDGHELASDERDTFTDAKMSASNYLHDPEYARDAMKVMVRDGDDEVVWDKFVTVRA